MQTITTDTDQLLWIGLESYNESNSDIFFGRDEEIQQLSSDIFHNVQTVIYGPSGTGKTSLIRAGVFKIARENGYFPIYIRLIHDSKAENYYRQVIDAIEMEAKSQDIDIENTIRYIKKDGDEYVCSSLWEYLHCNEFWTKENYPITPLIVIDQFEEIFTLCQERQLQANFFEQISDLCDNKLPLYVKDYINDRGNERMEYSESVNYRFVISLREDFLARLEELAENVPALKRNRFSLQCTNEEQALEIITKPSPGLVSEEVAVQIIERVTSKIYRKDFTLRDEPDILVEPSILSLFCSELDKKRRERGLGIISKDLIGEFGDNIIRDFYFESLKDLSLNKVEFLEIHLLTDEGFRDSVALQDAKKFGFTDNEISNLTNRRLVRIEEWDGAKRIEFTHDVLCKIAQSHKQETETQKFLQEEEGKRQLLQEEQERERTKRNIEYNQKKRAAERNVLVHKGRRLIDNALDFGELRTINGIPLRNPVDQAMAFVRLMTCEYEVFFEDLSDSEFVNQQVFRDPLLNNSDIVMSFYKDDENTPTIDGVYGVELKYEGSLISDIYFKGKRVLADGSLSFGEPIYILGGYCGIHIDYDENQREIQRTYLDDLDNPIVTMDGYSVVQIEYDEEDNPIKVRYFIFNDGKLSTAKHLHGNHGYDSVFDKNGNEIERYFVDENEQPTTIVSGVYGKRMTYETDSFRLLTISNIDSKGYLMADEDGYVTVSKVYDEKGLPTQNFYLDEKGRPWKTPSGIYGSVYKIDFINNIIEEYYVDEQGSYVEDNEGACKIVVKINEKRQITEYFSVDRNDNIIESKSNYAIQLWSYDEQNRLQSLKCLNKDRLFVFGKRFDCNKEGTHIVREYYLSGNGIGKNNDFEVEGIEYSFDGDDTLPVLQIFINESKQYKTCNDGYNAVRTWEDDKGRIIKQYYFDVDGTPMPNNSGVFGVKLEYLDEETTKRIYLDAEGNMMEDNNGVAFTIETENSSGLFQINYNMKGEPYAKDGWVFVHQERENTNQGYQERIFVLNSSKEQIQIYRPHRADAGWGLVPCMYVETTFDDKGRPLSEYFRDADGHVVGDTGGDSYTTWEYDDDNNLEILSLYDVNDNLRIRIKTIRDSKNRITEQSYINDDNEYFELERGYSGEIYEYDDEENKKIVSFIDSKGEVCNNKDGFAHRIFWYDNLGRSIAQKEVTIDGIVHGYIGFREFIDSEKRECAYYIHFEDDQGHVIPNDDGSVYVYIEDDVKGRTIKRLYLNADKLPMMDKEGDYGLSYEYIDEENMTIIRCLDENSQPHNNNSGYGIIHLYKDEQGRDTKRMHFAVDGTPATFAYLLGCYGLVYEYPNENNIIVGYLDEHGEIAINSHGYAYREECSNPETGIRSIFYYDKARNNIQSSEDEEKDFGYAIFLDDNWRYVDSLGKDGRITNNAAGYARRAELYEDGKLRFYKYIDSDNKPMADSFGDYGKEILRSDDGSSVRYVSLNAKYERHLNDYGYCFCDVITDIAGGQVRIWRDMKGDQVLPKLRFAKRIESWFAKLRKKEKDIPVFNCRQIGAIFDCVLGNIEGNGTGKKYGLRNTYVLLQYGNWEFGDDFEDLDELIANTLKQSKHLVLLPVTLDGSVLQNVGDIIEIDFPAEPTGMRFMEWGVNIDTFRIIIEKQQERKTNC